MSLFFTITGFVLFVALIAYPILIMPRMFDRPDFTPFDNYLYAHRGLHNNEGKAPENSLAAFHLAVEAGYGIELDIQLSKDKVPMVFHDYTLNRICNSKGRVNEYTCEELQKFHLCHSNETIPTLSQVLQVVDGKVPLIIEFKIEHTDLSLCPLANEILKNYKGTYCMESFNPLALNWYKNNQKDIIRGQLATDFIRNRDKGNKLMYWILSRLLLNRLGSPDFIAYEYLYPHLSSLSIVRDIYKLKTIAWTIKSQEELEESKEHFNYFIFDSFIPKQ